jgi:Transposase
MCQSGFVGTKMREACMSEISILAIDLAKNSFQVCGVRSDGVVVFNRAVSRVRLEQLLSDQSPCVVAMEACATSHHWGRVAMAQGHDVRLIPANYVKPFVKRQKNDFADAAAIAEAASRPSMSFVAVKSAEKQGRASSIGLGPMAPLWTTVPDASVFCAAEDAVDQRAAGASGRVRPRRSEGSDPSKGSASRLEGV